MATQHVNPYLQWKKWKNDLRMEAFLLTCRISGGFLRVKISMSTQQHGVRTNRDMSIAQRNAGFMYLFEYGDISIPL